METKLYTVTGMTCAACSTAVQVTLRKVPGVASAEVNLLEGRTSVTYDPDTTSPEALRTAVRSIGYDLLITDSRAEQDQKRQAAERQALKLLQIRLSVAVAMSALMMTIGMHPHWVGLSAETGTVLNLIASSVVYFFCAYQFHSRTLKQLHHGAFTMDTLISMSTTAAYLFSLISYITFPHQVMHHMSSGGVGLSLHSYFDAIGMIVSFVLLGKYIEERAKHSTTSALRKLMSLTPSEALRVPVEGGGSPETIPVSAIRSGDHLLIRRGDRVPVDGTLLGAGSFDESSITGEPLPADKDEGDAVYSGTLSVGAPVTMIAQHVGAETLLGRVVEAVRHAQATKAPIQRIADRISGIFVPIIIGLSLLTFVLWSALGTALDQHLLMGLYFAISVLVIACPCGLGLATPTAIAVAMGRATEAGLLIRDAAALEELRRVTDIIFDKTGTLTTGDVRVVDELWQSAALRARHAALIADVERHSSHPVAHAITDAYGAEAPTTASDPTHATASVPHDVVETPGVGISFVLDGVHYSLSKSYPTDATLPTGYESFVAQHAQDSIIYYSTDRQVVGVIALSDEARPDAAEVLSDLSTHLGITTHLLSGDTEARAHALAQSVGIQDAMGGCSPLDKKDYIERLKSQGRVVAMVGDGINDSPALAAADVAIAMAGGSDIAADVAQLTAINGSLSALPRAIRLSRKTAMIIKQNFFWVFIYNAIAIPIAAGLWYPELTITPSISAGAMAMSSICVVLNSLRLKRLKI